MPSGYLLFLDTETTGLPRRWHRPYAEEWEWPCVAQLGWEVYTVEGQLVKTDHDYLPVPAGRMPAAAVAIHGLTEGFLQAEGQQPAAVLGRLLQDLRTFRPRVVGHFLQLDFHVLGAAFARENLSNPLPELPQFCTMQLPWPPAAGEGPARYLRLHELHERLFGAPLPKLHDALIDAQATARCFFELRRRGIITPEILSGQAALSPPRGPVKLWRRGLKRGLLPLAGAAAALLLSLLYYCTHG